MANYLICYDIADPRRLQRVHRLAVRYAIPVQYSVFLLRGNAADLARLLDAMASCIDETKDDVRAYTVAPMASAELLGHCHFAEGMYVFDTRK